MGLCVCLCVCVRARACVCVFERGREEGEACTVYGRGEHYVVAMQCIRLNGTTEQTHYDYQWA